MKLSILKKIIREEVRSVIKESKVRLNEYGLEVEDYKEEPVKAPYKYKVILYSTRTNKPTWQINFEREPDFNDVETVMHARMYSIDRSYVDLKNIVVMNNKNQPSIIQKGKESEADKIKRLKML